MTALPKRLDNPECPQSYGGCNCSCHHTPGVKHAVACCRPSDDRGEQDLVTLVCLAEEFARGAHAGQTDKNGEPYIDHCARVAYRVHALPEMIVAWLHDVVEDTPVELSALRTTFPEWVVEAVDALTRRTTRGKHLPINEGSTAYYARVRANDIALAVKYDDIADNTDPRRLLALPAGEMVRLMHKYATALDALEER